MKELRNNNKLTEQQLSGKELYELKRRQKEGIQKKEMRKAIPSKTPKKIGRYLLYGGIVVAVVVGLGWFIATRPNLPPITDQGHIESVPLAHITDTSIPDNIQRHMLEHADGDGDPGIIIQYNCKDFDCEPDLVSKLTSLIQKYPDNVYLAPNNYDGKIILTRLGRREILADFDEQAIKNFIE